MPLPTPIDGTQQYLAAILEELRGLRADLQQRQPSDSEDGLVELREELRQQNALLGEMVHQADEAAGYRTYPATSSAPPEPEKPAPKKRGKKG